MAKYQKKLTGDFNQVLQLCEKAVMQSVSASYEDGSDFESGNIRVAVRVYERYSAFGKNRVSLNLTLVGEGNQLFLTAITSGGSQAMFLKMNTIGEEAFLDTLASAIGRYHA